METLIKHLDLSLADFSPVLIRSYLFSPDMNVPKGKKLDYRLVDHYEFELILESSGGMYVDDIENPLIKGDIVFRRPGQTTQGILPYKCYAIIFDLTNDSESTGVSSGAGTSKEDPALHALISYKNTVLDKIPLIFNTSYIEKYIPLFNIIMEEFINPTEASELIFKINILQIINMLYHEVSSSMEISSMLMMGQYSYIRKALEYIRQNWNKPLNLDILSLKSGVSKNHFLKVFTKVMNLTPNDYITKLRIDKAKQLLAMTNDPINLIAIHCGYDNIPYFSYLFKRKVGISPNEFRRKYSYY